MNASGPEFILHTFRHELRSVAWEGEELDPTPYVTRRTRANGLIREVTAFHITASTVDSVIDNELEYHARLNSGFEWKVFSFDKPATLTSRLAKRGFSLGVREALMVCDVKELLRAKQDSPAGLVRTVDKISLLDDFRETAEAVFQRDYSLTSNELLERIEGNKLGHVAYVAYSGEKPVGVGRLYTDRNSMFGGLYGGGIRPEFRKKGFYRALVFARAKAAYEAGATYLLVDALPSSYPILVRLGFTHLADTWPCRYDLSV